MKIIKLKVFIFLYLISIMFLPIYSISSFLSKENNLLQSTKKQDFYNDSYSNNDYQSQNLIQSVRPIMWDSNSNMNVKNNLLNMNNNLLQNNNYIHNTSPNLRINNQPNLTHGISNTVKGIENCPCISRFKCQPCGITPVLDFSRNSLFDCPCAPKPACPVCPPLSLIHEIASKKVKL